MAETKVVEKESVTVRFAGDSGDGMQLTGTQFSNTSALFGNDVSTLPDYPAEIRAPAGTMAGVSGFQIHLAAHDIYTPGDKADCLVAMNPAALKISLAEVVEGGIVIANSDAFTPQNLKKVGYETNPLEDDSLSDYELYAVPITTLTLNVVADIDGLGRKEAERCKNFFALGVVNWLYDRPIDPSLEWIEKKFGPESPIGQANKKALLAGFAYGDTVQMFRVRYRVPRADLPPGTYRQLNGNQACAYGAIAAAHSAKLPLVYASYPITPASDILHTLAGLAGYNVYTFQAEDEIAAMCTAIGAAYGGAVAMTGTSGPGLCLKSEAIGLAVMAELPVIIIDVQRGGPSTGLPTKTEQADLLQALFGRNGESPVIVLAPQSPADAFDTVYEAVRLAFRAMAPVIVLSDGFIANGAEPWRIPDLDDLPPIETGILKEPPPDGYQPYARDPVTLARKLALPGTPGMEHRIGGLEKEDITGNVNYRPENHHKMTRIRSEKIQRLADFIPEAKVFGEQQGDLLVVGWGSTYGAIRGGVERALREGRSVGHLQLRHLNPFPKNVGEILQRYKKILVPEINEGQLAFLLKATFLRKVERFNLVRGLPFKVKEIHDEIVRVLEERDEE